MLFLPKWGMIAFLQLVTWHRWPFRLIDMCFPNTTIWLCSIMQCVSRYQSCSGQPSHDKAHWNTYSLSKNDSWKCFGDTKILVNSHNKIFKQYFWKYENKLPGRPNVCTIYLFYILEIYFSIINSSSVGTYELIACARLQKVFLCYYAAWYVSYHSDPLQKSFWGLHDWLDLPWTGSPLMHFIVIRGFTFYTASNHLYFLV